MGSIDAARRAGKYEADKAARNRITPTDTITEKSNAATPYKVVRRVRPTSAEPRRPIPSPIAASSDASFRMSQITCSLLAPGKDEAFAKKLSKNLSATCAHGASNRNLSLPRSTFGQQQIRYVDAGDDQHEAYRTQWDRNV